MRSCSSNNAHGAGCTLRICGTLASTLLIPKLYLQISWCAVPLTSLVHVRASANQLQMVQGFAFLGHQNPRMVSRLVVSFKAICCRILPQPCLAQPGAD